jgi:hypothetical protein
VIETDSAEPYEDDRWVGRTLMLGKGDNGAAPIAAIGVTMRDERYFEVPNWYLKRGIGTDVQVANTWPKITARGVYGLVGNGKEPENPCFSVVAATFERQ